MSKATVTAASKQVVAALRNAVADPGTASNRKAAEKIVHLRSLFEYAGRPDWAGRSGEYRDLIQRLYVEAEVPPDSESSMQASLRYHVGNVLRSPGVAPAEDLAALGMATEGPLGRVRQARTEVRAGKRQQYPAVGDPVALANMALEAVRAIKALPVNGAVTPVLLRLIDEAASVVDGAT